MAGTATASRECTPMAFVLAALIIIVSAGQISFNKYLIHPGRFPFVVPLMLLHMVNSFTLSGGLLFLFPSMFPSITDPDAKVTIDKDLFHKGIFPVGLLMVGSLVLANAAYLHCSVAFLQMVKEANIVPVYFLSLLFALERFRIGNLVLLLLVVFATSLTVTGEVRFSALGFTMQIASQLFESTKVVVTNVLLSSKGKKLDPMSFVLLMTPVAGLLLAALCGMLWLHPLQNLPLPAWTDIKAWWPVLLGNACMAFVLNVIHAFFIKATSGVAFMVVMLVKDAVIVLVSAICIQEPVSKLQAQGFALQLCLVTVWTLMKTFPEYFEEGVLPGAVALLLRRPPPCSAPLDPAKEAKGAEKNYGAIEPNKAEPQQGNKAEPQQGNNAEPQQGNPAETA